MEIERTLPQYLQPEDIETLARQNVQLMTELWITKDRLFVLEDMLEKKGIIDRKIFESIEPEENLSKELEAQRVAYIKRIMGILPEQRTTERLKDSAPKPRYG
jgi:hypothetical protein